MRSHLRHLDGVDGAHRREGEALVRGAGERGEELLGGDVGRVERGDGLGAAFGGDEFG